MLGTLRTSARARRRLLLLGVLVGAAVAGILVFVLIPNKKGGIATPEQTESVQQVQNERQVPVTPARRAAIDRLFDRFVPTAMGRDHTESARPYVTPNLRGQATDAEWRSGQIPVPPFNARPGSFHGWRTVFSYPKLVSVELTLQPRRRQDPVTSYAVDVKLVGGRWLVDSIYQLGTHGGVAEPPKEVAAPATPPKEVSDADNGLKGRLGVIWILVPLGLLSLIVIVPAIVFTREWARNRRVMRQQRDRLGKELPPLPRPRDRT